MQQQLAVVKQRVWPVSKHIVPLVIGGACLWFLGLRLESLTLTDILPTIKALPAGQWIAALIATGVSFWALGRYDVVIHRHFGTGCPARRASVVGAASIAIGQLVGMGVFTGALVRWRMLPDISLVRATRIAVTVAASFIGGLAVIILITALVTPVRYIPSGLACVMLLLFIFIALFAVFNPFSRRALTRLHLPSIPAICQIVGLTLIDTTAAALALYCLVPGGVDIGFVVLFPAYLMALCAALITGTPGGVGPFELTLLALLPDAPPGDVMAAIVAFRLVYYAVPALIAAGVLCRPYASAPVTSAGNGWADLEPDTAELAACKRSEIGVCRQNGARVLQAGRSRLAVIATRQALIALFDPLSGPPDTAAPAALRRHAKGHNKVACHYKISARYAARYRRAGLKTLHIADEAVLDPSRFTIDGRAFRQLRRKLRKAGAAGVSVKRMQDLPMQQLAGIDRDWKTRNGPARGLSMGQFCPHYLRHQRIYVAFQGMNLIGFISFHQSTSELCLDLMRLTRSAPDGTMHLLLETAISEAADEGRTRLSLAALPPDISGKSWLPRHCATLISAGWGGSGLAQFKTCFKPRLEPLYVAANSSPALALALLDLALAIRRPHTSAAHHDHEENAFARARDT